MDGTTPTLAGAVPNVQLNADFDHMTSAEFSDLFFTNVRGDVDQLLISCHLIEGWTNIDGMIEAFCSGIVNTTVKRFKNLNRRLQACAYGMVLAAAMPRSGHNNFPR